MFESLEGQSSMLADVSAERGVISGVISHGIDAYYEVTDILSIESFTLDTNQLLWRCLEDIYSVKQLQVADLPSLFSSAHDLGIIDILQKPEERAHVRAIINFSIDRGNLRKLAIKLRKLALARQRISQHDEAKAELSQITGDESVSHILAISENKILDHSNLISGTDEPIQVGEHIDAYLDNIINNPKNIVGVSTGYPIFDEVIGGGLRAGVSMIGARYKQGKSMLAQNIAYNITSKLNVPVLYIDTEMIEDEKYPRMLSMISGVLIKEIEKGTFKYDCNKLNKVKKAAEILKNLPLKIASLIGIPMEDILSIVRRWLIKDIGLNTEGKAKPCTLILDYFKLSSDSEMNDLMEWQALNYQCIMLYDFCIKHNLPCLTFTQLNKDKHIASSDRVLASVSNYSVLDEKTPEEIADNQGFFGNRKLVPKFLRHGAGLDAPGDYINFYLNGKIARFKEGITRNQLIKNANVTGFDLNNVEPYFQL